MDFYPQEVLILKQHMSYPVIFFRFNTLKGTVIILTVVILDFSTLSCTNLQILTPERYDEHSHHFDMEVPPSPRFGMTSQCCNLETAY